MKARDRTMEKLNKQDLEILLDLLNEKKESIHQKAIHDKELREIELDLDFIGIKLNSQLKQIEG